MRKKLGDNVRIEERVVGLGNPVFVIAEAGVNHFGNIEIAKHLIDMAVIARADAVKFQIFKTENLVSSVAPDWIERLKPKELPYDAFKYLKEYCEQKGIMFLATAHDDESLDFYNSLNPIAYKIGSGEVSNTPYLRKVAKKKKPVILSTGMYDMDDVRDAVNIFLDEGNTNLILLHCITCYPPVPEDINLKVINALQKEFGCSVGYSDHTIGNDMVLAAVAVGASVIEKHIAVSKNAPGSQDCPVSCDERDLIEMVNSIRKIEKAIGTGIKFPSERELKSKEWARKSVVAKVDIKKGDVITEDMLILKRPGTGISPKDIDKVIGRIAKRNIKIDSLLQFDDVQ
ncbi:MAG: N-acetylneuraminate synthase family protein [Nitrospirota bacterium]